MLNNLFIYSVTLKFVLIEFTTIVVPAIDMYFLTLSLSLMFISLCPSPRRAGGRERGPREGESTYLIRGKHTPTPVSNCLTLEERLMGLEMSVK